MAGLKWLGVQTTVNQLQLESSAWEKLSTTQKPWYRTETLKINDLRVLQMSHAPILKHRMLQSLACPQYCKNEVLQVPQNSVPQTFKDPNIWISTVVLSLADTCRHTSNMSLASQWG
jgi:hypothetical protein